MSVCGCVCVCVRVLGVCVCVSLVDVCVFGWVIGGVRPLLSLVGVGGGVGGGGVCVARGCAVTHLVFDLVIHDSECVSGLRRVVSGDGERECVCVQDVSL